MGLVSTAGPAEVFGGRVQLAAGKIEFSQLLQAFSCTYFMSNPRELLSGRVYISFGFLVQTTLLIALADQHFA